MSSGTMHYYFFQRAIFLFNIFGARHGYHRPRLKVSSEKRISIAPSFSVWLPILVITYTCVAQLRFRVRTKADYLNILSFEIICWRYVMILPVSFGNYHCQEMLKWCEICVQIIENNIYSVTILQDWCGVHVIPEYQSRTRMEMLGSFNMNNRRCLPSHIAHPDIFKHGCYPVVCICTT